MAFSFMAIKGCKLRIQNTQGAELIEGLLTLSMLFNRRKNANKHSLL